MKPGDKVLIIKPKDIVWIKEMNKYHGRVGIIEEKRSGLFTLENSPWYFCSKWLIKL